MTFSGQIVTFGVTFRVTLGETPKVIFFCHFRVTWNFSGFRGFWEVRIFLNLRPLSNVRVPLTNNNANANLSNNNRDCVQQLRMRYLQETTLCREKRVYTTTVAPLLSRSVARPRGRRAKKNHGVYHFPGKTREKGIHHRSGKKGIHHRASDPKKEKKEGFHGGGVYFCLPCFGPRLHNRSNLHTILAGMLRDVP